MTGIELFEKMKLLEEEIQQLREAYNYEIKESFSGLAREAIRIYLERKERDFIRLSQLSVME